MSKRQFSFLKRIRIKQDDVQIDVRTDGPNRYAYVRLRLVNYALPNSCRIILDVKDSLESCRFDLGSLSASEDISRIELDRLRGSRIRFSLSIVDSETARRVATADTMRPTVNGAVAEDARSLLPVDFSATIAPLLWDVHFQEIDQFRNDAPVLMINPDATRLTGGTILNDSMFRACVFPAAIQAVLTRILVGDMHVFAEDGDEWADRWLRFGKHLCDESPPRPDGTAVDFDACDQWIQRVKGAFCKRHNLVEYGGLGVPHDHS